MASAGDLVIQLPIPDAGSDTKDGQSPLGGFRTAVNLALSIAKKLPPRDRRTMHDAIDELKRKAVFAPKNFAPNIHVDQSINASEHATVQADRSQSVSVSVDWALHIGVLIDELLRVVAVQLEGVSDRRPTVIFADDFHAISNEAIEEWMRSLPYRLPKVRIVITADPVRRSLNLGQEFRKHTLPAFTRDEVEAFLRSPSDVAVSPALTDPIFETTGGWPWAVALIANTLTNREFQAQDCLRLVGSDAFGQNVADGLEFLYQTHPFPQIRESVQRLSVFRRFDEQSASYILHEGVAKTAGILSELRRMMLVCPSPGQASQPARLGATGGDGEWTVPSIARAAVLNALRERDPAKHEYLHERAASYYWELINDRAPLASGRVFDYWGCFEDRSWERLVEEWLFHAAQVPNNRATVAIRITRWYLEAFFWYEWNVPHWFCQRLLEACATVHEDSPADTTWIDNLQTFHTSFPRTWTHAASNTEWQKCKDALLRIRSDFSSRGASPPGEPTDASQIYALATHLLARCIHYEGKDLRNISHYYDEAKTWYVGEGNKWARVYVDVHEADSLLKLSNPTLAVARLPEAEVAAREFGDTELLVLIMRMDADRLWLAGNSERSMANYLKACIHALSYQVDQLQFSGGDEFPDPYTREVYAEIVTRTSLRLEALQAINSGLAAHVQELCMAMFAPYWEHSNTTAADACFPPPPADKDLGVLDSDYLRHVRWCVEQRREVLDLTLADPLILENLALGIDEG